MRVHTIMVLGSQIYHFLRGINPSLLGIQNMWSAVKETPCAENIKNIAKQLNIRNIISRNSRLTGPQKVHVSIFWRMKRHLAKLKGAKATSHGKSTVTGHGESTTRAKGASKDYLRFWSGAIPPFALGWWFCAQGALR